MSILRSDEERTPLQILRAGQAPPERLNLNDLGRTYGIRVYHIYYMFNVVVSHTIAASIASGMPYVLATIQAEFNVSDGFAALPVTAVIFGSFFGVIFGGNLGDWLGRWRSILICNVGMVGLNVFHLAIPRAEAYGIYGFGGLVVLRAILGLFYGGAMANFTPFTIEVWGDHGRGAASVFGGFYWAITSAYCIGCWKALHGLGVDWRVCITLMPLIPGICGTFVMLFLPESPRWLFVNGHHQEGQKVMDKIFESKPLFFDEYVGKAPHVVLDDDHFVHTHTPNIWKSSPSTHKSLILVAVIYAFHAGISNAVWTWQPKIVEMLIRREPDLTIFQYMDGMTIIGGFLAMLLIDFVGRRWLMAFAFVSNALIWTYLFRLPPEQTVVNLLLVRGVVDSIAWMVVVTYMSEIFPTTIRTTAVGYALCLGRVNSVICPLAVGSILQQHLHLVIFIFSAPYILLTGLLPMLQETAGRPLMDETPEESQAGKIPGT